MALSNHLTEPNNHPTAKLRMARNKGLTARTAVLKAAHQVQSSILTTQTASAVSERRLLVALAEDS